MRPNRAQQQFSGIRAQPAVRTAGVRHQAPGRCREGQRRRLLEQRLPGLGVQVELVVLLASPPTRTSDHIQALGKISRIMSDPNFRKAAYAAASAETLYQLFREAEKPVVH